MGSFLSSCSKMVAVGSFDMDGVPAAVAWEVFSNIEAYPSFVPNILEVQTVRSVAPSTSTSAVGTSWNERRIFNGKEIVMRRTITGVTLDLEHDTYTVKVVVHLDGMRFSSPDAVETCTFTIAPKLPTEKGKGEKQQSCTISWTMAYISGGLRSTLIVLVFKSCLLKSLLRYMDDEMPYYYEEGLRRTTQQTENVEKSSSETTNSTLA